MGLAVLVLGLPCLVIGLFCISDVLAYFPRRGMAMCSAQLVPGSASGGREISLLWGSLAAFVLVLSAGDNGIFVSAFVLILLWGAVGWRRARMASLGAAKQRVLLHLLQLRVDEVSISLERAGRVTVASELRARLRDTESTIGRFDLPLLEGWRQCLASIGGTEEALRQPRIASILVRLLWPPQRLFSRNGAERWRFIEALLQLRQY